MNFFLLLLMIRPFICEQSWPLFGIVFNLGLCFSLLLAVSFFRSTEKDVSVDPDLLAVMFLPLFMFISGFFSVNGYNSEKQVLEFIVFALFFIIVKVFFKDRIWLVAAMLIFFGTILGLRALYQGLVGFEYIKNSFSQDTILRDGFYAFDMLKNKRVTSWFSSPNLFSGYISSILFVAIGVFFELYQKKKNDRRVFFIFLCVLVLGFSLLAAKTMMPVLSWVCGMAVFIGLAYSRKKIKLNRVALGSISIVLLCFVLIVFWQRGIDVGWEDLKNSFNQRAHYSLVAWQMIKERPVFGFGPGSFGIMYLCFKNQISNLTLFTHNSFLQLWAESGVFALIFFLGFIFSLLRRALSGEISWVKSGFVCASIIFLLNNFADYSLFIPQSAYLLWILLACAAGSGSKKIKVNFVFLKTACVFALVFLIFKNSANFISQDQVDKGISSLKQGRAQDARTELSRALKFNPLNDGVYYLLGSIAREQAGNDFSFSVISDYKTAIYLNPRFSFYYYGLAEYYMKNGAEKKAKYFLLKAHSLYPSNIKFQKILNSL